MPRSARRRLTWALALALFAGGCADLFSPRRAAFEARVGNYESGKQHLVAGHAGLAIKDFSSAPEADHRSVDALNGLGIAYDRIGRHDLALRYYTRALAQDPNSARTLNNVGYSYLLQKKYDLATAYLRDARARAGRNPIIAENQRAAVAALARQESRNPTPATVPGEAPERRYKPRLVRTTRWVQTLLTKPPRIARRAPAEAWKQRLSFLASPMVSPVGANFAARRPGLGGGWNRKPAIRAAPIQAVVVCPGPGVFPCIAPAGGILATLSGPPRTGWVLAP